MIRSPDRKVRAFSMRRTTLLSLLVFSMSAHATEATVPVIRFAVSNSGQQFDISPQIQSPFKRELRYEISSHLNGKSGRSSTRQSGMLTTTAGEWLPVSTLRLTCHPEDRCEITLRLWDQEQLVTEERYIPSLHRAD